MAKGQWLELIYLQPNNSPCSIQFQQGRGLKNRIAVQAGHGHKDSLINHAGGICLLQKQQGILIFAAGLRQLKGQVGKFPGLGDRQGYINRKRPLSAALIGGGIDTRLKSHVEVEASLFRVEYSASNG